MRESSEQPGKTSEELTAQWQPEYWQEMFTGEIAAFERLLADFDRGVGLVSPGMRGGSFHIIDFERRT